MESVFDGRTSDIKKDSHVVHIEENMCSNHTGGYVNDCHNRYQITRQKRYLVLYESTRRRGWCFCFDLAWRHILSRRHIGSVWHHTRCVLAQAPAGVVVCQQWEHGKAVRCLVICIFYCSPVTALVECGQTLQRLSHTHRRRLNEFPRL
jgi:hypothetical protein